MALSGPAVFVNVPLPFQVILAEDVPFRDGLVEDQLLRIIRHVLAYGGIALCPDSLQFFELLLCNDCRESIFHPYHFGWVSS